VAGREPPCRPIWCRVTAPAAAGTGTLRRQPASLPSAERSLDSPSMTGDVEAASASLTVCWRRCGRSLSAGCGRMSTSVPERRGFLADLSVLSNPLAFRGGGRSRPTDRSAAVSASTICSPRRVSGSVLGCSRALISLDTAARDADCLGPGSPPPGATLGRRQACENKTYVAFVATAQSPRLGKCTPGPTPCRSPQSRPAAECARSTGTSFYSAPTDSFSREIDSCAALMR
jgi:hypothetical protein